MIPSGSSQVDHANDAEIAVLVQRMHDTKQRLAQLTGGGVLRSVEGPHLAHESQQRLVASESAQRKTAATQLAVLNALPAHIAVVDRNGTIVSVNDAWSNFAASNGASYEGCGPGQNYLKVCDTAAGPYSDEAPRVAAGLRSVLAGEAGQFTCEYPCASGAEDCVFRLMVSPVGPHGDAGAVIMHVNITERAKAERDLAESEERFRAAFEQAAVGMVHTSPEGRYVRVNDKFCELTGYTREELLQLATADLMVPDDRAAARSNREKMIAGKMSWKPSERRYLRKDGGIFVGHLVTTLLRDSSGAPKYFVSVVEDVTARKESEHRLRENEALLRIAGTTAQLGGWSYDVGQARVRWSDEICAILEVPLGTVPTLEAAFDFYAPGSRAPIADAMGLCITEGRGFDLELEIVSARGRRAWVRAVGQAERGPGGDVVRVHGAFQDITRWKQAEAEAQARRLADAANNAKSAFLAAMSHEIRTPMNGVIGMVEILHQTSLQDYQVEIVDLIRDSAFSLLAIIEDILDFSKIEAGKLLVESAPLNVADVVEKVCALQEHVADGKNVELTLFVDPRIPAALLGDGVRLRQVLLNLTSNAIKFSSGGERHGRVAVRATLVDIGAERVTTEISVTDNGIGMDQASLKQVFSSFAQADVSTTRRFGGTGLGLAISRSLVGLMRGEISVQSVFGEGSTFVVRLPFDRVATERPQPVDDQLVAGLECVVIGDSHGLAADLVTYLRYGGAKVRQAPNCEAVTATAGEPSPGCTVWVLVGDASSTASASDASLTATSIDPQVASVTINQGRRRQQRLTAPGTVVVDRNGLTRGAFISAVAIAAGRAQAPVAPARKALAPEVGPALSRAEALRRGRLVLVAEDNETNQKVILQQFKLLGLTADIAGAGVEALARWRTGEYALLLTDLHMPGMDGYELTRTIRSEEGSAARIPIVVLTANALKDEAERCREAGADDFLTKPTQLASLQAVLGRWLPPEQTTGVVSDKTIATGAPVDIAILAALVGNDPSVIRDLIQDFHASAAKIATEMTLAWSSDPSHLQAAAAAHKLKSSARTVGALALGALCAEIEQCGRGGNGADVDGLFSRFEAEYARVSAWVDVWLESDQDLPAEVI